MVCQNKLAIDKSSWWLQIKHVHTGCMFTSHPSRDPETSVSISNADSVDMTRTYLCLWVEREGGKKMDVQCMEERQRMALCGHSRAGQSSGGSARANSKKKKGEGK